LEEAHSAPFFDLLADLDELFAEDAQTSVESKGQSDDTNPFIRLLSISELIRPPTKLMEDAAVRELLRPDSDVEHVVRSWTLPEALQICPRLYEHEKQRLLQPRHGFHIT